MFSMQARHSLLYELRINLFLHTHTHVCVCMYMYVNFTVNSNFPYTVFAKCALICSSPLGSDFFVFFRCAFRAALAGTTTKSRYFCQVSSMFISTCVYVFLHVSRLCRSHTF